MRPILTIQKSRRSAALGAAMLAACAVALPATGFAQAQPSPGPGTTLQDQGSAPPAAAMPPGAMPNGAAMPGGMPNGAAMPGGMRNGGMMSGGGPNAQAGKPGRHGHKFDLAKDVDKHIAWLHAQLQITPAEEPQWTQFAQVMRDNAATMVKAAETRAQKISTMNASDTMTSYAQLAEQHAQDMGKLAGAFQTLYGSFSDQQKQTADTLFRHPEGGGRMGHHAG